MKTNFDYIDDVVVKAVDAKPQLSDKDRGDAAKQGRKVIAGFRVKDDAEEKRALDAIVAKKRSGIEQFLKHRDHAKSALKDRGLTAKAIVPTKAWEQICFDAGLYILAPDTTGRVSFDFQRLHNCCGTWGEKSVNNKAKEDWKWFLDLCFPNRKSPPVGSYYSATLILPDPPEDVAAILCKAQGIGMGLKVAAVAEAISFVEKPSEIVKRSNITQKDLWAQARGYEDYADWVKRDPIVYWECGAATAVIAQFGDFPIEKEVVDAVMAVNDLLPEGINPAAATVYLTQQSIEEQYRMAAGIQSQQLYGGQAWGTLNTATQVMPMIVNSQSWTGR